MSEERHHTKLYPFPLLEARGIVLLALGAVIPLLGLLSPIPEKTIWGMLVLFLFGIAAMMIRDFLSVRKLLRGFSFVPEVPNSVLSGIASSYKITLTTPQQSSFFRIRVRSEVPRQVQSFVAECVASKTSTHENAFEFEFTFKPLARGKLTWSKLHARLIPANGITRWQFAISFPRRLSTTVFPNHAGTLTKDLKALRRNGPGERPIDTALGNGREFESLRQYTIGDDLRRVDWKRSAHGRGLYIKVFRPETHQRINVAIDCSRRMGNRVDDRLQIEHATDAVAQLFNLARGNEDELGFFAFNHKVVAKIPCRKGAAQERIIRNALTSLELSTLEPDYQLLTEWAHANRKRSLLVLVTSVSNPAAVDMISAALAPVKRKHLPLVFAVSDTELQQLVEEPVGSLAEAFTVAAGVEQLQQIQSRGLKLSSSGVEFMYCRAPLLPTLMQKKYYELKLRGKL